MLNDLKNYFGNDYDEDNDSAILFCIKRAIVSFKNKRNYPNIYTDALINNDMEKYYSCIFDLTLYWINMQGCEFQTNHSENGVSRSFKSEQDIYVLHSVIPIARII